MPTDGPCVEEFLMSLPITSNTTTCFRNFSPSHLLTLKALPRQWVTLDTAMLQSAFATDYKKSKGVLGIFWGKKCVSSVSDWQTGDVR